jgi:hypothetical protein
MLSSARTGRCDATFQALYLKAERVDGAGKTRNPRPHQAAGDFELKEL